MKSSKDCRQTIPPEVKNRNLKSGLLVVDKPEGLSSQQVVSRVKRALGVKKAGHTGTLDPLATGVLPVALGPATKIIPYLSERRKIYRVEGRLGIVTDTYDAQGKVVVERPYDSVDQKKISEYLPRFSGDLLQVPPAYSAVKVSGRALYRYARKGETVTVPPRPVTVEKLQLLSFSPPHFELRIECSRGTYVRSLIHDLGEALGCGAHVSRLRREATGPFSLERAMPLEEVEASPGRAWEHRLSPEACLSHLRVFPVEETEAMQRVLSGGRLPDSLQEGGVSGEKDEVIFLTHRGRGLALLRHDGQNWRYSRVFPKEIVVD